MKIDMENESNGQQVSSFDKSGFADAKTIESLYGRMMDKILKSNNPALTEKIKGQLVKRLQRCRYYDPRLPDVYYGSAEDAAKAQQIAEKLHRMTPDEFLSSTYSYLWLDDLTGAQLYKVIDPSVLTSVESD